MKRFLLAAGVAALAGLTAAMGGSTAYGGSSAAAPIKVGVLTSLTANFAPWGIQFRSGAALAVNEINRKGGVKGRLLNLAVADDQSIPNGVRIASKTYAALSPRPPRPPRPRDGAWQPAAPR